MSVTMRSFSLTFVFVFSLLSAPLMAKPLTAEVTAERAVLIDGKTGAVLYNKGAFEKSYTGSTSKIATALYVLKIKEGKLHEKAKVSRNAVAALSRLDRRKKGPSYRLSFDMAIMGAKPDEEIALIDLLHALMIRSAGDAGNILAEHCSGSIPQFMDEVNAYLKTIGCKDTHLTNPHGHYFPDHTSTAYDLAIMTKEAMKNPLFREIAKKTKYTIPASNKQPEITIYTHNRLLKRSSDQYYSKAIGVKTGYSIDSGYCLVAAAEDEDRMVIATMLSCNDRYEPCKDAITLFEAAFNEKKVCRELIKAGPIGQLQKLPGAEGPFQGVLLKNYAVTYYPSESPEFKTSIEWKDISLPLKKGSIVGEVVVKSQDMVLEKIAIYADRDVEKMWTSKVTSLFQEALQKKGVKTAFSLWCVSSCFLGFVLLRRKKSN